MSLISDDQFQEMLTLAGLPVRPSYRPGEVCSILGISPRTFWRLTERYEIDSDTGQPAHPDSIDSYLLRSQRRVRYQEIIAYLRRNNTYERRNAPDPGQMLLFEDFKE
ncbi:helix-turn-helix domain-containing protein [uncultured Desulfobacter sp.]|uniref:helix-turn-helix domain-containing protein n=1 Tax=uncultured Desulfobacter sp. TaxID=240139 RepID=UPI002AAA708D|nr:helix-turn-helix domain-containing protein [uncultured Desulfobacter sp.]